MAKANPKETEATLADLVKRLDVIAALLTCQALGKNQPAALALALTNTGLPHTEVARMLGMTVQAVKDARRVLKKGKK